MLFSFLFYQVFVSAQAGTKFLRELCSPDMDSLSVWRRRTTPHDRCRSLDLYLLLTRLDVSCDSIQVDFKIHQGHLQEFSEYRAWLCLPNGLRLMDGDCLWDGAFEREYSKLHRVVIQADTEGVYDLKAYCIAVDQTGAGVYRLESLVAIYGGEVTVLSSRELGTPSTDFDLSSNGIDGGASLASPFKRHMDLEPDEYPVVLAWVRPSYPNEADWARIEGRVIVLVKIDERGNVASAVVEEADRKLLAEAAIQAARKFKFTQAKKNGVPVRAVISIPFVFCPED